MVLRPTCSGRAIALTSPSRTARVNTVDELMVAVPAPAGRLRNAHSPPSESASPITAPPCMIPAVVHRAGAQARWPRTSSAAAASRTTPSAAANGICATAAPRSEAAGPSFSLPMSSSARAPVSVDGYHPPGHHGNTPSVWRLPLFRGDPKAGRVSAEVQTPGRPHHPAATGPRMDLLVRDGTAADQAANLALEEALARAGPPSPLLRIWQNESCVVIGRAQRAAREVDLAACAASAVPVLRRASGGGTVFQDLGNLNISLAVPGRAPGLAADLAGLVAAVVAGLGLTPRAGERGVFVGAAKVSGLASHLTMDGSLAHATLLVTTPAARVGAFLTPAPARRHPT